MTRIQKQTYEQRNQVKQEIKAGGNFDEVIGTISILDDTTMFTEKESGKAFTCLEVQLKGCLIEAGTLRRYVGYNDLQNYTVSN